MLRKSQQSLPLRDKKAVYFHLFLSVTSYINFVLFITPLSTTLTFIQKVLLIFLSYNYLFSYFLTLYTDPGFVQIADSVESPQYPSFCTKCEMFRAPSTHHCRICDHCVLEYDHHCFFVGNCIGLQNKAFFLRFMLYASTLALLHVVMLIDGLARHYYMSDFVVNIRVKVLFFVVMLTIGLIGLAISGYGFLHQLYLVLTGSSYLDQKACYGKGNIRIENLKQLFGPNWIRFLLGFCHN